MVTNGSKRLESGSVTICRAKLDPPEVGWHCSVAGGKWRAPALVVGSWPLWEAVSCEPVAAARETLSKEPVQNKRNIKINRHEVLWKTQFLIEEPCEGNCVPQGLLLYPVCGAQ